MAQRLKHLPAMWETWVRSLGREDPLEMEMATHSSILAWRIPWMEEPGGLQSMGSQKSYCIKISFYQISILSIASILFHSVACKMLTGMLNMNGILIFLKLLLCKKAACIYFSLYGIR